MIVDELVAHGVTDAVLCPGSRSAPLSFALHAADVAGQIRLHVRVDERGAGFLALGLARSSGRPVPVVTTSGTAVVNLHPAVMEAHLSGVPLLLCTADRPPHLRGVGANQVVDQPVLFGGDTLRYRHDLALPAGEIESRNGYWRAQVSRALASARGALTSGFGGPAHLNIPFDVPLTPARNEQPDLAALGCAGRPDGPWLVIGSGHNGDDVIPPAATDEKCLFIADLTHPLAAPLARAGHVVISEAGGAGGNDVVPAGELVVANADFVRRYRPDRVVVLGRPTLFRSLAGMLSDPTLPIDVVAPSWQFSDLHGTVRQVAPTVAGLALAAPAGRGAPDGGSADAAGAISAAAWRDAWRSAGQTAARVAAAAAAQAGDFSSALVARTLMGAIPQDSILVLGSSQPPRDVARYSMPRGGVRIVANRGAAGIDGMVSTAIGVALGTSQPTYALLGDLTMLHDVSALAIGPHEPRPNLTLIVVNNDGGGIFSTLEQGDPALAAPFERIFGTPTGVQIAQVAEGFGAQYTFAGTVSELAELVAEVPDGLQIVEVSVSRTDLRSLQDTVTRRIAAALSEL